MNNLNKSNYEKGIHRTCVPGSTKTTNQASVYQWLVTSLCSFLSSAPRETLDFPIGDWSRATKNWTV